MAEFALCHLYAVEEFADGHQTPERVTDEDVWEDVLVERREIPLDAPIFERESAAYHEYYADFQAKSLAFAHEVPGAPDKDRVRRQTKKLSNDYVKESQVLAAASLARIRKALPPKAAEAFEKFLDARRHVTVVVRIDHEEAVITPFGCP